MKKATITVAFFYLGADGQESNLPWGVVQPRASPFGYHLHFKEAPTAGVELATSDQGRPDRCSTN